MCKMLGIACSAQVEPWLEIGVTAAVIIAIAWLLGWVMAVWLPRRRARSYFARDSDRD